MSWPRCSKNYKSRKEAERTKWKNSQSKSKEGSKTSMCFRIWGPTFKNSAQRRPNTRASSAKISPETMKSGMHFGSAPASRAISHLILNRISSIRDQLEVKKFRKINKTMGSQINSVAQQPLGNLLVAHKTIKNIRKLILIYMFI